MTNFVRVKVLDDDNDIHQHYVQEDILGEGMFGQTIRVKKVSDPAKRYAMKIQPKTRELSADPNVEVLKLHRELMILDRILPNHPNIIQITDMLVSPNRVFIVQDLCQGGHMLRFYPDAHDASGRKAFGQLVQAVHTCHEHGVVHCDIKGANVLFKDPQHMELKLIDFGQAVYRPEWASRHHNNFDHTKWFNPEEFVLPIKGYDISKQRDFKALGRVLHYILAGRNAPTVLTNYALPTRFRFRTERFDAAAIDLLTKIGAYPIGPENQDEVWTTDQILQHPWITGAPAIALEPTVPNLNRNLGLMMNDLTILKGLLGEWMVMPLKIIGSDQEFALHYRVLGRVPRGSTNQPTKVIMIQDTPTSMKVQGLKVIPRRLRGEADVIDGGYATRPPLALYMELLITLRVLPPHAHIVNIRDVFVDPRRVLVIRELLWYRHSMNDLFHTADELTSCKIFKQIAETVRWLHCYGVVHRDLHPDHILFTDNTFRQCKIVNFSKAIYVQQMATLNYENFQPRRYVTQQLADKVFQPNVQVDITVLGRILHAMMCRVWEPNSRECGNLWPIPGEFGPAAGDLLSKIGPSNHMDQPRGVGTSRWMKSVSIRGYLRNERDVTLRPRGVGTS